MPIVAAVAQLAALRVGKQGAISQASWEAASATEKPQHAVL